MEYSLARWNAVQPTGRRWRVPLTGSRAPDDAGTPLLEAWASRPPASVPPRPRRCRGGRPWSPSSALRRPPTLTNRLSREHDGTDLHTNARLKSAMSGGGTTGSLSRAGSENPGPGRGRDGTVPIVVGGLPSAVPAARRHPGSRARPVFSSSGGHDRNSSTESRHSGAVETAFLRPRRNAGAERPRRPSARGAILSLSGGTGVPENCHVRRAACVRGPENTGARTGRRWRVHCMTIHRQRGLAK